MKFLLATILCFCWLSFGSCGQTEFAPVVSLPEGKVRGLVKNVEDGKQIHLYQGIKFAQAERFGLPKPADAWEGIYDATEPTFACPQAWSEEFSFFMHPNMSEDCLYLNVFRPAQESSKPRSVIYYIHGGGFMIGTAFSQFGDFKHLVSRGDVVLVAIQYRLGLLGFGQLGNVPDNLGLRDQIFGLEWVRKNIHLFGGDPNSITIQGGSAGSMSVGALVLSPLANGLFHRAIMNGGAPNSKWSGSKQESLTLVDKIAKRLNCPKNGIEECLRTRPALEIANKSPMLFGQNEIFMPVYETKVLPLKPSTALKKGQFNKDVDAIVGFAKDEGSVFVAMMMPKLFQEQANLTIETTKEDISFVLKQFQYSENVVQKVVDFYTKDLVNPTEEELKIIIGQVYGHFDFICPSIQFAEELARHAPNNHYYSYQMAQTFSVGPIQNAPWMGVPHGSDSAYFFAVEAQPTEHDRELGRDLIQAIADFAKTGKIGKIGGVQWEEAFDKSSSEKVTRVMKLKSGEFQMLDGFYKRVCTDFWNKLEDDEPSLDRSEL